MEDDDAKLKAEIEAELDKFSISSLENEDIESDSKSETQSDDSDTNSVKLPESVLHCINIIKNRSKTVEELILQDLEDTDILSCSYGAVSNNHMHLRTGLSTEYEESSEQLMKILSEIEKEEFIRSKTNCASSDFVPEPGPDDLPMDEHVLTDDADINFGYCEVEEQCRQSFEAWQEKQKELEDKEKETLKAQRDREKKQFQEEEEKRHCWMEQFKVEKKKLENIQKQEQDKMNDELSREEKMWKEKFKQHEEYIRNLHLQMEEERTRFKDLQEKEKICLLKQQNNAAVKIQAKYKAFIAYKKYSPIIKEQIESKKRKAQEWNEKKAKIQQEEEEKRQRLEEKQRIKEERKKQKEEERKGREKEYEEKKNIVKQEREQLINKEKIRLREVASQQLILSSALKKRGYINKHLIHEDISYNKGDIAKKLVDENSKKQEDVLLWLVEESNKKENVDRQIILKESTQVKLKESISNQTIVADFKMEEKNENLAKKQCSEELVKQARKYENIDNKTELGNLDLKENVKEQFQLQEVKLDIQKQEIMEHVVNENVGEKNQIILGYNQEISEVKTNEEQKIIKDNQQKKVQIVEKENNGLLYKDKDTLIISMKQKPLSLTSENSEDKGENIILQEKEIDLKFKEIEENPKDNAWNSDVIFNTTDTMTNIEGKRNDQDYVLGTHVPCEELSNCNAESSMVSKEVNSLKSEIKDISEKCPENGAEPESMTCSVPESTLLSSIEEKRLAWIKSFKPWLEIFKQSQQKKIVRRKRPVKCPANMAPALDTLEILRCGPWDTLQQVTTVTFQDLPGCVLSTLAECTNLQFLSLRRCGLTSLHSLSNCKKLKYIDAQENHIEAIDCENLENLCVLLLNKNQLTSLHGLDGCTNIQCLELSHNRITRIGGLESLKNLQQLILDHNQLISTKGLCDTPTIVYLDCSHNHLTDVEGIENYGLLQILKLQGNYLSELPSLENLVLLRELHLDDNSISTVEAFSSYWLPLLQNLTISQNSLTKIVPLFHFVSLEKLDISHNCLSDLTSAIKWFDACYFLRELSLTGNPLLQETNWRYSLLKVLPALRMLNGDTLNSDSERHAEEHNQLESAGFLVLYQSQIREFNLLIENYITRKGMAAVVIQSYWRGYLIRRQIHFATRLHTAATESLLNSSIKNQTILKKGKRESIVNIQKQREKAAILIQAVWKGFILRKKLTTALEAIKNDESDEEYREIDLEDFAFDETALEEEWLALDSTRFPSQTLLPSNQLLWPKIPGNLKRDDASFNLPSNPAQAWLCNDKENLFSSEHTQFNSRSENRTSSWTPESKISRKSLLKSEKEKKISEEWGFKDISTAQQMLKRAQKMKSKKLKKNLDSTVRLALFKNNENKVSVSKSPKKAQTKRDGYFEDIEEDLIHKETTANEKLKRNREYTYKWLHTQVAVHETTNSRNMKWNHFLPELDPDVLNGGRVQLVARLVSREDTDLDLFSMTSGNALSVNREKKNQAHRHSAGSSSCSVKGIPISPMITNTRPSKKERISFRDNPVQLSGGWGSGKKKAKISN
uniref:Leucine rich repeats and IQ motif containing 1 n=1 Tax=Aotus nancymaae TaxID=37293 RepID=A0A2K5DDD9_AOTNA